MQELLDFIYDILLWIPKFLFKQITDFLLYLLSLIPDPGISNAIQSIFDLFNQPNIAYFLQLAHAADGFALISTAYLARFVLRRIPGIG